MLVLDILEHAADGSERTNQRVPTRDDNIASRPVSLAI